MHSSPAQQCVKRRIISVPTVIFLLLAVAFLTMLHSSFCYAEDDGDGDGGDAQQTQRVATESAAKMIALTFNGGPSEYTAAILDILEYKGINATFFVVGKSINAYSEVVRRAFGDGNAIGNHTYSHPNLTTLGAKAIEVELLKTSELIYKTIYVHPLLFCPPFGACSAACKKVTSNLKFKKIIWDYAATDYVKGSTPQIIARNVISNAAPGAIVALHDGGGSGENTVRALPIIIDALNKAGYRFVTVDVLLGVKAYKVER